jgi:predicted amidohydrolase
MAGVDSKEENIKTAASMIKEAAGNGADIVSLPEMWPCLYETEYFRPNAEPEGGPLTEAMSGWAKENGVYLVGGSIPLLRGEEMYNSCFVYGRDGEKLACHDKAHLFDIDVDGGITFKESDSFTPGDGATVFETELGTIGVEICFDVRFPEFARKTSLEGAKLIFLPAAFNMTTGPAHWELTMRARALDDQVYFAACSPARDENGPYVAYGHSMVVSPWGDVIAEADETAQIVYADIDTDHVDSIRRQLPLITQRRPELY